MDDATTQDDSVQTETTNDDPGLLSNAINKDRSEETENKDIELNQDDVYSSERPSDYPQHYWNEDKGKGNHLELAKGYNNLRAEYNRLQQERGGEGLEYAEDYLVDYKPPNRSRPSGEQKEGEVLDRYMGMEASDPIFMAMSKFAKTGNMSKGQFDDGMHIFLEDLHNILPEPFNAKAELDLLGDGGEKMIDINLDWVETLVKNGVVNEDEYTLLLKFGDTALGVQLMNKLRLNSGEKPIPGNLNGNANTGRKTPDECQAMLGDPRYSQDGSAGNAYRSECDRAFAETFGTNPA